jgi:cytochrome c nitrite reductase small subunit
VVHRNCIRCHSGLLTDSKLMSYNLNTHRFRMERKCWDCHRETPHGRVNSISSVPYARVPLPGSAVPSWLIELTKQKLK